MSLSIWQNCCSLYRSFVSCLQEQWPNVRWLGSGLCNRNVPFHWAREISEIWNRYFCWMESAPNYLSSRRIEGYVFHIRPKLPNSYSSYHWSIFQKWPYMVLLLLLKKAYWTVKKMQERSKEKIMSTSCYLTFLILGTFLPQRSYSCVCG